jgi:predicted molibdopterin-dependent oxidoreductase YjgC
MEFLVVQDLFLTETGQLADVILPAASFAEKEGTFTNTERRIQRVRQAIPPVGESQDDAWIITELARRIIAREASIPDTDATYAEWEHVPAADVMAEINALTPIYAGITYPRLEAGAQLQWPVADADHPGTPILHVGKFSRGLGRFAAVEHEPPAEQPDREFPLILTTGRVLYHWHGGEMTRRARNLKAMYPEALIEIHPEDAAQANVADAQMIRVASRRGEIIAKAEVNGRTKRGTIFATFHYPESAANFLTNPALDPQAKIPEYKACAVRVEPAEA